MAFLYEEKQSDSVYVQTIWRTQDISDGVYMAEADGCWDLIFTTDNTGTTILLSGPTSQPTPSPYKKGNQNLGIQFKPGTIMTAAAAWAMRNKVQCIQAEQDGTFTLFGSVWTIPTFATAETFVAQLAAQGFLAQDAVVASVLQHEQPAVGKRSVQRHFADTTTISPGYLQRIAQARVAIGLLRQNNMPLTAIAYEAGYADQAHMNRALKQLAGLTPAEIAATEGPIDFPAQSTTS